MKTYSELEMIVLFKMIVQGEDSPIDSFYKRVKKIAVEEGVVIHEFSNEFMMPTRNLLREDQTEMVLKRAKKKW